MYNYNLFYVPSDPTPAWMRVDNYQDFILPKHMDLFGFFKRK